MRRLLLVLAAFLLLASSAIAGPPQRVPLPWWLNADLTFWAPLSDPANPLAVYRGTGALTITRADNTATYVHPHTGLVTAATENTLRIERQGALIEGARTNILLRSRTLNNVAWTATNTTADNTITGRDGVGNSASWVAASDNNGTICQAVTIASAAYSGSADLKRITGTGTVKLSLDGGSTWGDDVSESLSTSAWHRASKVNQTLADPSLCIQLGTAGDNVAVDYAQVEAGAFASSRIPTTTAAVTRNADVLTFLTSGNVSGTAGTVVAEVTAGPTAFPTRAIILGTATGWPLYFLSATYTTVYDGTTEGLGPDVASLITARTSFKAACTWSGSVMRCAANGTVGLARSFDGDLDLGATVGIGHQPGTAGKEFNGHIKGIWSWNRAFTDAELLAIIR